LAILVVGYAEGPKDSWGASFGTSYAEGIPSGPVAVNRNYKFTKGQKLKETTHNS